MLGASQDSNREFITLLACVYSDGTPLPPALIYKGENNDLRDTWLEDFDHSTERAYFTSSSKGWSNENIGVQWLSQVFDPHTKAKAGRNRRFLILDGHNSHLNLAFIDYCDRNKIIPVFLPPHSTHRLQPLDIGLFSPLANYYTEAIDTLMTDSLGFVSMGKRFFWRLFRAAWDRAFTEANIASAFKAVGIWPYNPDIVLRQIKKAQTPPLESCVIPRTPRSTAGVRRLFRKLRKEGHIDEAGGELLFAAEKLAAENDILRNENRGLKNAIVLEKKKRKRGKAMKLHEDGEAAGQALFFSPARVGRLREHQKALEAAEDAAMDLKKRQQEEKAAKRQKRPAGTKGVAQKCANTKKRSHVEEAPIRPQKRLRLSLPSISTATLRDVQTILLDSTDLQLQNELQNDLNTSKTGGEEDNKSNRSKSATSRSGRAVRLPTRFK